MAEKSLSIILMLVLAMPVVIFAFTEDEAKAPAPAEIVRKQLQDAIKLFEDKKETYQKDVLDLFEKKEKDFRDKGDLKLLNLIKQEKDAFIKDGKAPTLFFITDQKRYLELAKLDLIKGYEKAIKDCIKMKLDVEAEKYAKELEELKTSKINVEEKKAKRIFLEAPFSAEAAKNAQIELAKNMGKAMETKIDLGKGVSLDMVLIPAGKFLMGSPLTEVGRNKDETQHKVTITKPFYMGKYEVTNELWRSVTSMNPPGPIRQNRGPVTDVSWKECKEFIKKLNEKTSGGFRLPTEAEWEYACRAGTTTAFSFGSSINKTLSNCDTTGDKPVGSYNPNAFGLYDMHGNVWEWCNDVYGPYSIGAVENPVGALNGTNRVLRGSSCMSVNQFLRSAARVAHPETAPPAVLFYKGFRLARTI